VRRIVLDTDTGVDDALAICLAMRSPELRVEAITAVHGNVPVGRAAENILRTLAVLGATELPTLAVGASVPLRRDPVYADDVHGWDGIGGASRTRDDTGNPAYPVPDMAFDRRPAPQVIAETVAARPGEVTVVAVGPLTNVALAMSLYPEAMRHAARIVAMAGAFRRQGNMSPVAEFNVYADPDAVAVVLGFGVPVTLVPLDATERIVLRRELVERHATHRRGRFVRDITAHYMEFGSTHEGIDGCYVHDPLAVAHVVDDALLTYVERRVVVETTGTVTLGQTVADLREPPRFAGEPNARIALDADPERFLRLFETRVLAAS